MALQWPFMTRSVTPLLTEGSQHKTDAGVPDKYKRLINLFVFTVHFLHLAALQLTVSKRQKNPKKTHTPKKNKKPYFQSAMEKMLSQVQRPLSPLSLPTLQVL